MSRSIALKIDKVKARAQLALCEAKKQKAKARLFRALIDADDGARLEYSFVTGKLSVSAATIRAVSYTHLDCQSSLSQRAESHIR